MILNLFIFGVKYQKEACGLVVSRSILGFY
jgi:hypothetical protein